MAKASLDNITILMVTFNNYKKKFFPNESQKDITSKVVKFMPDTQVKP